MVSFAWTFQLNFVIPMDSRKFHIDGMQAVIVENYQLPIFFL